MQTNQTKFPSRAKPTKDKLLEGYVNLSRTGITETKKKKKKERKKERKEKEGRKEGSMQIRN